ncbi:GDSL esterase/lipase At1g29660 [Linum grandiflorum]
MASRWSSAVWAAAAVLSFVVVVVGAKPFPCYFIFGDSLADNGNNNMLNTIARVNYPPYGIDFPAGPTGRFTNGRTIVDFFAEYLGFSQYIPPFATAVSENIVTPPDFLFGVNYASGVAGILDETGQAMGGRIPLGQQLENHEITTRRIVERMGDVTGASNHLMQCLYTLGFGNNDFLNNYFRPNYPSSKLYTVDQFSRILVDRYIWGLLKLYGYGARKIAVFPVGQIGCIPFAIQTFGTEGSATGCAEKLNDAANIFNGHLKSGIDKLNRILIGAQLVYIGSGSNALLTTRLNRSSNSYLGNVDSPCCLVESMSGQCVPNEAPCPDRTEYVFWDWFHPTDAFNSFTAEAAFESLRPLFGDSSASYAAATATAAM